MRKIERWTRQDSKRKKKGEVKKRDKRGQGKTERRKRKKGQARRQLKVINQILSITL